MSRQKSEGVLRVLSTRARNARPMMPREPCDRSGTVPVLHSDSVNLLRGDASVRSNLPEVTVQLYNVATPNLLRACEIAFSPRHSLTRAESNKVVSCGFTRQGAVQSRKW